MKPDHGGLLTNEHGSIARLEGLVIKLQQDSGKIDKYHEIIQEEGIVERVVQEPADRVFYILQKPAKREISTTTKLRIVFDVSAKPSEESPSLNECLEMGPPLQDLLWNVLMRNCIKPVALTADIKQAFLQVCISAEDRDLLQFHWIKNKDHSTIRGAEMAQ